MSHSLLSARTPTHVKIVVVALLGAILIVLGGIAAHVNAHPNTAELHAPVIKAAKPLAYTGRSETLVR